MKMRYPFLVLMGLLVAHSMVAQKPDSVIYEDLKKLPKGSFVTFTDTLTLSAHSTMESLKCDPGNAHAMPYDIKVLFSTSNKMRQIQGGKKYRIRDFYMAEPLKEFLVLELKKDLLLKIPYEGAFAIRSTTDLLKACGDRLYIDIQKIKQLKPGLSFQSLNNR